MRRVLNVYVSSYKGLSTESWMLSIVMLINRTGSMVLPFLGVYMSDQLGFDLKHTGWVLSCFGIGSVIGSWLGGYITDKIGEYPVQVFSLFVSAPLFLLYPFFDTPLQLGVMVLIQSIISEMFRPANAVAITKYASAENLTRAFSINRMAINLGFSVGPAIGGFLAAVSYNFLFIVNASAVFIAAIAYVVFFRKRQQQYKADTAIITVPKQVKKMAAFAAYKDGSFWMFCVVCSVFSICFFQLLNTLPLFYKNVIGLSQKEIGLILGFSGIVVVMFEMVMVSWVETKWKLAIIMLVGTLLCAASYSILAFHPNLLWLYISIGLLSLGEIWVLPFMSTITALRSGAYNKGTYMGINGMAVAIAFIISPVLGTKIADLYGFSNLWMATGIVLLLTAIGFYITTNLLVKSKT